MNNILEEMFKKQKELNIRVGKDPDNLNDEQITKWTQDYLSALSNECEELRSHTGWKWWKAYTEPVDRNQMKIEIVDMFHFLVSLALPLMDANEFADLYFKKLGLNHKRQEIGYDDKYEKEHKQKGKEDNDELFEKIGGCYNEPHWDEGLDKFDKDMKALWEKDKEKNNNEDFWSSVKQIRNKHKEALDKIEEEWKEEMMKELEDGEYPDGGVEMDNLRGEIKQKIGDNHLYKDELPLEGWSG